MYSSGIEGTVFAVKHYFIVVLYQHSCCSAATVIRDKKGPRSHGALSISGRHIHSTDRFRSSQPVEALEPV